MEIVAADIGGTHARFAIADVADGRVVRLDPEIVLKTADHPSLQLAWGVFGRMIGRPLPAAGGIAIAAPVQGAVIKFTNNPWVIRPHLIREKLGLDSHVLVNDFGAVGHAVAQAEAAHLRHLAGPARALAADEVISIVGPGTGLGVACVVRRGGRYHVVETEGGHLDFAPLDTLEDRILASLRLRYRRVSAERIVSGPGLRNIHEALALIEGQASIPARDDKALWDAAMTGEDPLAVAALDRFCLSLGSIAGDIALVQGATAVVIAGGLGQRLADRLPRSGFAERFTAKGRFEARMAALPVHLITHPQPGLFGAAAAFAQEHAR